MNVRPPNRGLRHACDRCGKPDGMRNTFSMTLWGERPAAGDSAISEQLDEYEVAFEVCDSCARDPAVWTWMLGHELQCIRSAQNPTFGELHRACPGCGLPTEYLEVGTCNVCGATR
jgi:hypothetical protein